MNTKKNNFKIPFIISLVTNIIFIAFFIIDWYGSVYCFNEAEKCKSMGYCVKYKMFYQVECVECEELLKEKQ